MKFGLLVFFAAGTLAAPFWVLDDNLPRMEVKEVGCSGSRIRQGQTYTYDYAGETINNIEGSSKLTTGLQLRARILITPLSECKFSMQLKQAELLSKDRTQEKFVKTAESAKFKRELEQNELLFTMNGNKIHSLLAHKMEPVHILNIKRGMLSALQVDETTDIETDVNGMCQTTITNENGKLIESKKLTDCSVRAVNEIGIQTATIKTQSTLKPLDSTSKCIYEMESELIKSVVCTEQHLFRPFSAGYETPSGAMTVVKQELIFVKYKPTMKVNVITENYGEATTLVFDHSTEDLSLANTVNDHVEQIMERLATKGDLSAKQDSAHEFTSLVFLLRKMDQKRMKPIWNKYFDCIESKTCTDTDLRDVYRQYLLDAVAYCGTSTCISMVRNVIINGEVSGERMNMFLQSISLVGKTTKDMISNVLEIVKKKASRQAYLTLGTLLSRHCGKSPEDCVFSKNNPITEAERFLEKTLRNKCEGQENHDRVEEILMALKAIGNARRPTRVRSTLIRCAKNAQHANITRAAFDAFRGMPCDGAHTDDIVHVLTDELVDPEIRIHAFTALMKCPSEDVLHHAIHALEIEQSRQVASFIWSHLTNVMESSDPKNTEAKAILEQMTKTTPLRKVDLPIHQFSRSYEKSIYVNSLESGATAEGHVIFHPDGYFPKSALFNLTAQVLGVPVPIVEAMVGMDGLETVMENVLFPNGVLPDNFVFKIFNNTFTADKLRELIQTRDKNNQRTRRAVNDKLTKIHNRVNMKAAQPTGHFSIKIMGQEVRVMSYDDIHWMIDQIDNMNVIQLMNLVATGGHKTFSKSMMFLEMTHTVPTGLGLPLKLKLVGSTVGTVELDGKFDIRNMFWGRGAVQVKGHVKPSAVVELSGQMGIESHFVSSGVFVNSSMYVSNMMKGSILYREGQQLKINLDTPEEPIQLLNFSSTPFMYINEKTDLIEGVARKINPDVCLKSKLIGYGLCTSVRLPVAFREYEAPYYPLSGPAHFGMKLVRGDEKLTTWQFLVSMVKKESTTTGTIEFSTPGAFYDRKLSGKMVYSDVEDTKTLTLSTEKYGKRAEIDVNYNTITHRATIESKNNFFTPKDIVTKIEYFNQSNIVSQQYGVLFSAGYDWYKFEHVSKYVRKTTGHMLHSSTMYYPKKSVTGALEYDTTKQKVTARLNADQVKQAVEVSGQWENEETKKGFTLTATHLSSGKSATFYTGFVNKENSKEFITTATVLEKSASNVLGYYNRNGLKSVENVLIVDGKKAEFGAVLDESKTEKVLTFNVNVLERKANSQFFLVNSKAEKSVKMVVSAAGKTADAKVGCYNADGLSKTFKFDFNFAGRHGELFVVVETSEGYRTTVGAVYDKYVAGLRGAYTDNHGHGKSLCSSMYYGTEESEKEPVSVCTTYHTLGTKYVHKRLTFSVEMKELKKKFELTNDFEKHTGHINLKSQVKYNNAVKAQNEYDLKYTDYLNTELKMDVTAGKYKAGWKVFTKTSGTTTNMGVESYVMEKTILLLNKYEIISRDEIKERKLTSELVVNGKTMPVSTQFAFIYGGGMTGPSFKLNVGKYSFAYATLATYIKSQYGYGSEFIATKDANILVKLYQRSLFTNGEDSKELSQKLGVTAFGKTYEYGWEAAYENRGTPSKSAHALTFRIQYATTRKSTIAFTFANGNKAAELMVDWEYIPTKHVSHSIRYTKRSRQLDISIEFLPKMFATFMARVDKNKGYSLTTDMGVNWKNYKRSMQAVNGYKNTNKEIRLSTSFGKEVNFAVIFTKTRPMTLKLAAQVFNYNGKIVGVLTGRNVKMSLIYKNRPLLILLADYNRAARALTFTISNEQKTFFKISGNYNRFVKKLSFSISGGKRDWFQVNGRYSKKDGMVIFNAFAIEKLFFKAIAKKTGKLASLKLVSPQLERDVTFVGKINRPLKSVTLSAETTGNKVGATLRADWNNLVIGAEGFYNKFTTGWEAFVEKHAVIYKMKFTPSVFAQVTFEVQDDRILKMTVQRSINRNLVNETSFQYTLSKDMCQFAFKWNTGTIRKVVGIFKPVFKTIMEESKKLSAKVMESSQRLTKRAAADSGEAILVFLKTVDKTFDDFDFIAARNKVGKVTVDALKKLSTLIRKSLKEAANGLDKFRENFPEWMHKVKEFSSETKAMMKNFQIGLEKNMKEISQIAIKVATNLTESTKPVVNKVIQLIKDFKFRGKPLREIVVIVTDMGKEYVAFYTKEAKAKFVEFKVKSIELGNKVKVYILKMKVPYRKKTVEQVLELVSAKVMELREKFNKIEFKKMIEDARLKAMDYEIQGKQVKNHLILFRKNLKNLPEETRKAILEMIRLVRVYATTADVEFRKAYGKVTKFAKPLTEHMLLVGRSVDKHFGPVYAEVFNNIKGKLSFIEIPSLRPYLMKQWTKLEDFVLPLVKPMKPLYNNLKNQVRDIKILGFKLGALTDFQTDMIEEIVNFYTSSAMKMMKKETKKINLSVEKIMNMSPEQMVDNIFDSSADTTNEVMAYVTKLYKQREATFKDFMTEVRSMRTQFLNEYNRILSKSMEEHMEFYIHTSSEFVMVYVAELSSVLRQLAQMDIAGPTWKAWKQADLLNHLAKYGINQKLSGIIKKTKDADLAAIALDTVEMLKQLVDRIYEEVFIKTIQMYGKIEKVHDYIRSIPKKEYEEWFQELKQFTLSNKKDFVSFLTHMYEISSKRITSMYKEGTQMTSTYIRDVQKDYVAPARKWYKLVAEKSTLVYQDVKQPSIDVYLHYKDIATKFGNKYYGIVKAKVTEETKKICKHLKTKMEELNNKMEEEYEKFMAKYGDMSWEEVGNEFYKYGEEQTEKVMEMSKLQYKKLTKLVKNYKKEANALYNKAMKQYKKYWKQVQDKYEELKPKAVGMYQKYEKLAKKQAKKYINKAKEVYSEMKSKVTEVYNNNKDKTLMTIYIEIKTFIVEQVKAKYVLVEAMVNKKTNELKALSIKYYTKADVLMRTVILPELKKEGEAIINQTLRCSVDLAEEIVKAYYPHYTIAKNSLSKAAVMLQKEAVVALENSKVVLKENADKLIKMLNDLPEKVQNHEMYKKLINHEYVVKAIKNIKELIKITQDKIEELKAHPAVTKYTGLAKTKYAQLEKELKRYNAKLEKYYKQYSKHAKVVKLVKTLKQIQESVLFTVNKVSEKLEPSLLALRKEIESSMKKLPMDFSNTFLALRTEPEESFWKTVSFIFKVGPDTFDKVKSFCTKVKEERFILLDLAKDYSKLMLDECTDAWTKETTEELYSGTLANINKAKKMMKKLPEQMKTMMKKAYKDNVAKLNKYVKNQHRYLMTQWNKCPLKAFVDNQLWMEIAEEVMAHELVDLSTTISVMTRDKMMELKDSAITEFKRQRVIMELKAQELISKATDKYHKLKAKSIKQYKKLVVEANKLVARSLKFLDETTIADIVEFTTKQYEEAVQKVKAAKEKLLKLKTKYIAEVKRLYAKYEVEGKALYKKWYKKGKKLTLKLKDKMMPYYIKYREQAEKLYNKYYPVVAAKYNELYEKAELKYKELSARSIKLYKKCKVEAIAFVKKTKTDAYNKWMNCEVRAKLIAFKKMTIRETIVALKKLPKQTKVYAIAAYNKYYTLASDKLQQKYAKLMQKYLTKKAELVEMARPITKPTFEALTWIQNEITETAVFIYKYHHMEQRYNFAKNYIVKEYKRAAPLICVTMKKYAKEYKEKAIKYAKEYSVFAKKSAEELAIKAGHKTLRGIHSTMRYIDNIDVQAMKAKTRAYLTMVNKYISIDAKKGEIVVSIPCGNITPKFSHHIRKVHNKVRRSVDNIKQQGQDTMNRIKTELNILKTKAEKLRQQIVSQVMENTAELREDMQVSYKINKKVAERVYSNLKIIAQKGYKVALAKYKVYKVQTTKVMKKAQELSKIYYKKFLKSSKAAYLKAGEMFWDIYEAGVFRMHKRVAFHSNKLYKLTQSQAMKLFKEYKPIVKEVAKKYYNILKVKGKQAKKEIGPYYQAVKTGFVKVSKGQTVRDAFYPMYRQMMFAYKFYTRKGLKELNTMKTRACKTDPKLCKLFKESIKLHRVIYDKYAARINDLVDTCKARVHRIFRKTNYIMAKRSKMTNYNAVAMIFGNNHILTFDNKFYNVLTHDKAECQYLLAHDFANDKFSIISQKDAIIVRTPEMSIKIRSNGKTKATVGKEVITSLPVESELSKCVRMQSLIFCHFVEQKLKVVVDLRNFLTTVSMSGWHYGKSRGLLGTNNRESYDDWKLPNGGMAKNIYNLQNAYEITGKAKCHLHQKKIDTPSCKKVPSSKCDEVFRKETSPYAHLFNNVDPEPFRRACELETADCKNKESAETIHCSSTAAYVSMARSRGYWARQQSECMSVESHSVDEEWVQKPSKKAVDIVFMMSQRRNVFSSRKQIGKVMVHLEKTFKRSSYKTKYALVGFGGAGIHEKAHIHPLGTGHDVFGNVKELAAELSVMPYKGKGKTSNDGYHAILAASKLRFRPGASKVFILFNTEPHTSHEYGPAFDEAVYALTKEVDATLFVFDKFKYKNVRGAGQIIGQTTRKLYTTRHVKGLPQRNTDFPTSEYTEMALTSNGGWFSSLVKIPKQTAHSLFNAVTYKLKIDSGLCKQCRVQPSWTGISRALCQSKTELTC